MGATVVITLVSVWALIATTVACHRAESAAFWKRKAFLWRASSEEWKKRAIERLDIIEGLVSGSSSNDDSSSHVQQGE